MDITATNLSKSYQSMSIVVVKHGNRDRLPGTKRRSTGWIGETEVEVLINFWKDIIEDPHHEVE